MSNIYRVPSIDAFLPSVKSFGQAVSEEKIFYKSTNQKKELPVRAIFVIESERNDQSL
jgi:ASC-1-like (ASCH) protein